MSHPVAALSAALADQYHFGPEIGHGGMARVYQAVDHRRGAAVAIKVLREDLAAAIGPQRFLREIGIVRRLRHPAIVPLLDSGEVNGQLYMVLPLVPGGSLRDRLAREVQLPVATAVRLATEVADALACAHELGIVHRDVKPENILLENDGALLTDFGVARVTEDVDRETLSTTGIVLGTIRYMSPEQASGLRDVDGRSDIYSLGCVLYEMLAGEPPFNGPTVQAIAARHMLGPPPPIRIVRPNVSEPLEAAVHRCLAKVPADRFRSMEELVDELRCVASAGDRASTPVALQVRSTLPLTRARNLRRSWWVIGPVLGLVVLLASLLRPPLVATDRFLVLPCRTTSSGTASRWHDRCTAALRTAFQEWKGVTLVSGPDAASIDRRLQDPFEPASAQRLARRAGAAYVVWVRLNEAADTTRIIGTLMPTETAAPVPQRVVIDLPSRSPASPPRGDEPSHFRRLVRALLVPSEAEVSGLGALAGTNHLMALRAMIGGDSAFIEWNLALAREQYATAFTIDPLYAEAKLRFARVGAWAGAPPSEWLPSAHAAEAAAARLTQASRSEVAALIALGEGNFPLACRRYRSLIARDSTSYTGWFGLGECISRDTVVVPDVTSASGWRFRGGFNEAIEAYRQAMVRLPLSKQDLGGAPLVRMAQRLMVHPGQLRFGVANDDRQSVFAAYLGMQNARVSLTPFPVAEVLAGRRVPQGRREALTAMRRTYLGITSEWVARSPLSQAALRAHAYALELSGHLDTLPSGHESAIRLLRQLRMRTAETRNDIELATAEIRVLVKLKRFAEARDSALRLLRQGKPRAASDGRLKAGLAALVGDANQAADLLAAFGDTVFVSASGEPVAADAVTAHAANRLLAFAALGGPSDSIRATASRLTQLGGGRVRVTDAALFRPQLLAFPTLGPPRASDLPAARLERALATGQAGEAAAAARQVVELRKRQLPGEVSLDQTLLEARLILKAGDTAGARDQITRVMRNWSAIDVEVLFQVPEAAAVGQILDLYRQLFGGDGPVGRIDGSTFGAESRR